MKAVELFAGAGGLALGVGLAGFDHVAVIERDQYACATIKENQRRQVDVVRDWPLYHADVKDFDYKHLAEDVDLLCAGLPCQPFSVAGKGRSHHDTRDMFSEVVRAARELLPKAILIENVRGLTRSRFRDYFAYLLLALASPASVRLADDHWRCHLESLRLRRQMDKRDALHYDVYVHTVNAANYGVPQWRDRVFIVAFRRSLDVTWIPPQPLHDLDALLWAQWTTGAYWSNHGINRRRPSRMSYRVARRLKKLQQSRVFSQPALLPWRTVRDAIVDLPSLRRREREDVPNHVLRPGARVYHGHTGSLMDEPAKTLKAGSHGVPGGENALSLDNGRLRYFSVRECARVQTFPDDYIFVGPWSRTMRQVGNAVPVQLARVVAEQIRLHLETGAAYGAPGHVRAQRVRG